MKINFFNEDVPFKISSPARIRRWISSIVQQEGFSISSINYIFCSDEYLHSINLQYLNHDTLTDIVTFDNSEEEGVVESDIFISVDRVRENALSVGVTFDNELNRVMVHGVLHLCGYGDKSSEQKKEMREKEDACLSLLRND